MTKYASGGFISGVDGAADILIRIGPCETLIHSDGRITRNGVTVDRVDLDAMRRRLAEYLGGQ